MTPITPLQVGSKFPAFNLESTQGTFTEQSYAGQEYVVYFYPRASTPGCTAQACGLQEYLDKQQLPVPVLGVSPDTLAKITKFKDKYSFSFPLLADPDLVLAKACGVYGDKKFMGIVSQGVHRIAFLVDAAGNVKHVFDKFKAKDFAQEIVNYYSKN